MKKNDSTKSVKGKYSKYLFLLFFLGVLAIAVMIVKPFISTLIISAIVAYVLYPVYSLFFKHTKHKGFSAAILIIMILLISLIPITIIAGKLTKESYEFYKDVKQVFVESSSFESACLEGNHSICKIYSAFSTISENYDINIGMHLARGFSSIASLLISKVSDMMLNIPKFLLHLFIGIFAMFYMFVDGAEMLSAIKRALPLKAEHSERILKQFDDVIYATVYGAIIIALTQGFVAAIGFFIFGVSSPVILGLLTVVAAFIPFLGAALVWLPVAIGMLINGAMVEDSTMMLKAGGLILYGALVISIIDNFMRPRIVGQRAGIHPLIILLGVFGGIALFGFSGVIVGPLLLTLFVASLKIYQQEKDYIV